MVISAERAMKKIRRGEQGRGAILETVVWEGPIDRVSFE